MSLTSALITRLEKADSPRLVRAYDWMLRKSTGVDATEVFYRKYPSLYSQLYGYSSYTGKTITADAALDSTAFYAGCKIISEDMGTLPFFLYRRSPDGKTVDKAVGHQLFPVLHDLVNPEVSAGEFVEATTAQAIIYGTGYAQIQRFPSGVFLFPWQNEDVRTDRTQNGMLYFLHKEGAAWKTYSRDQVFNLKGFTLNCETGDAILRRARNTLGITLSLDEFAGRYFSQGSLLDIVLKRPVGGTILGPEQVQAIKEAWVKWHRGLKDAHEPAVLQDGMDVQVVTPKAAETQLIEQRKFQVVEVCRLLRLPPHKLADLDRATFSNIDQQSIEYIQLTLSPWARRWRDTVHRCLLTFDEQRAQQLYAEHSVEALQRGDFATQAEGWRKLLEKGVYSINEVRRFLNLNPVLGGDERFIQLNLGTVQEIAAGANLPSAPAVIPVRGQGNASN